MKNQFESKYQPSPEEVAKAEDMMTEEQLKIQEERIKSDADLLKEGALLFQDKEGHILLNPTKDQIKDIEREMNIDLGNYKPDVTISAGQAMSSVYHETGKKWQTTRKIILKEMQQPVFVTVRENGAGFSSWLELYTKLGREGLEEVNWDKYWSREGGLSNEERKKLNKYLKNIEWDILSLNDKKQVIEEMTGKKFDEIGEKYK